MFKKVSIASIVFASLVLMAFKSVVNKNELQVIDKVEVFETYRPIVVLELFTSQGCSSCPSADALLEKVKKEFPDGVFALSYHVDYWNYIGWKDPFSKSNYAEKQRKYNMKFRNRSNYTPQLVVNGKEHFVGSSTSKMYGGINKYKDQNATNEIALLDAKKENTKVSFSYSVKGSTADKNVRAILVLDERTTSVKRGENRNKILKNSNIVVAEKIIDLDKASEEGTIQIPKIVKSGERISLLLLVESASYDITAAAKRQL